MNLNNRQNIQEKLAELELLEKFEYSFERQDRYHCIRINDVSLDKIDKNISTDKQVEISNRLTDVLKNEIEKMKAEIKTELEKL